MHRPMENLLLENIYNLAQNRIFRVIVDHTAETQDIHPWQQ